MELPTDTIVLIEEEIEDLRDSSITYYDGISEEDLVKIEQNRCACLSLRERILLLRRYLFEATAVVRQLLAEADESLEQYYEGAEQSE